VKAAPSGGTRWWTPSSPWGGSIECFYYAFGETDVLGVFDVPDQAGAAALSLMINSTGNVTVRLKPLMTPEDIDAASKLTPSYRAPGQ